MTSWQKAFREHHLHDALAELETWLKGLDLSDASSDMIEARTRAGLVLDEIFQRLQNVDPAFVTRVWLDGFAKSVTQAQRVLQDAWNQHNTETFATHLPQLLLDVGRFPWDPFRHSEVTTEIDKVQEVSRKVIQEISAKSKEALQVLERLEKRQAEVDQTLDRAESTIADQRNRIQSALNSVQDSFQTSEESRKQDFKRQLSAFHEELEQIKSDGIETLDSIRAESTQKSASLIDELEQSRNEAAEMVSILTDSTLSGAYGNSAGRERRTGVIWVVAGVSLLSIAAVVASVVLVNFVLDEFVWQALLAKILGAAAIAAPGVYAMSLGSKHLQNSIVFERIHLEFATIRPYLASLDDKDELEIRKRLAEKYFTGTQGASSDEAADGISAKSLVKAFLSEKGLD